MYTARERAAAATTTVPMNGEESGTAESIANTRASTSYRGVAANREEPAVWQRRTHVRTRARTRVSARGYRFSNVSARVLSASWRTDEPGQRMPPVKRMRAVRRSPRECRTGATAARAGAARHFNRRRSANSGEPPVTSVLSYQLYSERPQCARSLISYDAGRRANFQKRQWNRPGFQRRRVS